MGLCSCWCRSCCKSYTYHYIQSWPHQNLINKGCSVIFPYKQYWLVWHLDVRFQLDLSSHLPYQLPCSILELSNVCDSIFMPYVIQTHVSIFMILCFGCDQLGFLLSTSLWSENIGEYVYAEIYPVPLKYIWSLTPWQSERE